MSEKTKKILMKELYKFIIALTVFAVIFAIFNFVPSAREFMMKTLEKDTDLEKVISLLGEIVKEVIPFQI